MEPGADYDHCASADPSELRATAPHTARMLLDRDPNNPLLLYATAFTRYILGQHDRAKPLMERLSGI